MWTCVDAPTSFTKLMRPLFGHWTNLGCLHVFSNVYRKPTLLGKSVKVCSENVKFTSANLLCDAIGQYNRIKERESQSKKTNFVLLKLNEISCLVLKYLGSLTSNFRKQT